MRLLALLFLLAAPAAAQPAAPAAPYALAVAAGYKAAMLCSGIFSGGRTQAQIEALELTGIYPEVEANLPSVTPVVDMAAKRVSVSFDPALPPRVAEWRPRLGCAQWPIGAKDFALPRLDRPAPDLDAQAWPMGDARALAKPAGDARALTAAVDGAFAGRFGAGTRTTGVVIVQRGRIVAERYAPGFGMHTPNRTWSVAKSLTASVIGAAAQQGLIDPAEPTRIPAWSTPGDPRAAITVDQLLRMASGLHSDTAGNRTDAVYFGGAGAAENAAHWPLEAQPGTRFRYANNDMLLAMLALRARIGPDATRALPFEALLEPIGMTRTTIETDWAGDFVLSSQVYSTARDLARLGLLYAQDGVWNGTRILPAGWRDHVSRADGPQPTGRDGRGYGAGFWRLGGIGGLPADAFSMNGNRGQIVVVIPSRNLVIVRRGEDPAGKPFEDVGFSAAVMAALN